MIESRWLPGELVQATDRVEAALARPWPLVAMAEIAGYSPFHFHRAFRRAVGEPPGAFVERLRLERAALSLLASETPITQLAWEVGFRNPETFARRFRKRFGVAARDYRRHQLELFGRLGLEAGKDPGRGPDPIRVERVPPLRIRARRRVGDDEPFDLGPGEIGLTLDWPGVTEPGRVRQDLGAIGASRTATGDGIGAANEVGRLVGDGLYATLPLAAESGAAAEHGAATESPAATVYQRLFVWAMGGRNRLRPGAILEMWRGDAPMVYLPVSGNDEGVIDVPLRGRNRQAGGRGLPAIQ